MLPILLFSFSHSLNETNFSSSIPPEVLQSCADSGNATAAYLYSQICPNLSLSLKYLEFAANANIPEAILEIGRSLETTNSTTFATFYERAMSYGNV